MQGLLFSTKKNENCMQKIYLFHTEFHAALGAQILVLPLMVTILMQGFPTKKNGRAINHARILFCTRAFARIFCECSQSLLRIFCDYCKSSPPHKCGSENCNRV